MNAPHRGRHKRMKPLALAHLTVALVIVLLSAVGVLAIGERTGMAPPAGYSAGQLIFDDQFLGTSSNSAHWNTLMSGQGERPWNSRRSSRG